MRLQKRVVAEGSGKPTQFLKKHRVGQSEVVFEVAVIIVFAEVGLEDLVASEANHHGIGLHGLVVEHSAIHLEAVDEMVVAECADGDVKDRSGFGIDPREATIAATGNIFVEAIKKSLTLPERLLKPGNGHGQSLRAPRALGPCGSIGTTAGGVMKMGDGDEDFQNGTIETNRIATISQRSSTRRARRVFGAGWRRGRILQPRWRGLFPGCGRSARNPPTLCRGSPPTDRAGKNHTSVH